MKPVNLSVYIFNAKIQIMRSMEFKFDFLLSILMNFIVVMFRIFIWASVYRGITSVDGISYEEMIIYSVMANFLSIVFTINVESYINNTVKSGSIVYLLARPVNMIPFWLSSDLGQLFNELVRYILPFSSIAIFVVLNHITISCTAILLFIFSSILSYFILWGISFCVGSIAFWVLELGTISRVKNMIIFVLSGQFVPVWFFPASIRSISGYLPFEYTFQAPLGYLIGKYDARTGVCILVIQAIWSVIFMFLAFCIWHKASKKITVQGG